MIFLLSKHMLCPLLRWKVFCDFFENNWALFCKMRRQHVALCFALCITGGKHRTPLVLAWPCPLLIVTSRSAHMDRKPEVELSRGYCVSWVHRMAVPGPCAGYHTLIVSRCIAPSAFPWISQTQGPCVTRVLPFFELKEFASGIYFFLFLSLSRGLIFICIKMCEGTHGKMGQASRTANTSNQWNHSAEFTGTSLRTVITLTLALGRWASPVVLFSLLGPSLPQLSKLPSGALLEPLWAQLWPSQGWGHR